MNNIKSLLLLTLVVFAGLPFTTTLASELPQFSPQKHMGVATCGNATCHSVTQLEEPGNVSQDEYPTWLFHDRHSKAFTTLLNDESKRIAEKLGLEDARR